jgi:peptide-methionine (S)-S-oxide reductase
MKGFLFILVAVAIACSVAQSSTNTVDISSLVPATSPQADPAAPKDMQKAVFAGGCFWGAQAVFQHVKGVKSAVSGYSGGTKQTADYETVSSGKTGHAESVEVTFDPSIVSYQQLLYVFFSVVHDPTELNFQGPDHGTQYRSAIFYLNDDQKKAASELIEAINKAKVFPNPLVTQVVPFEAFYRAEDYHQDYMKHNPDDPYIVYNDKPKVVALKEKFPDLYTEK